MATGNHEEIRAWGWLLSELKSIAQREGVEVTLDDEDCISQLHGLGIR